MTRPLSAFILLSLLGCAFPAHSRQEKVKPVVVSALQAFPLDAVRLHPGIEQKEQLADRQYLLSLSPDMLLWTFRKNVGLPTPGKPMGGWEAPGQGWRGYFLGHYLSACALMYRSTGETVFKQRGDSIVTELAKCQAALGQNGYLSAFPSTTFDDLEAGKDVPVPYYTIHKILAGLVDMNQLGKNKQALAVAQGMVRYFKARTDKLSDAQRAKILQTEQGGIADTLFDLYKITGDKDDLALAHRFEHHAFLDPLRGDLDDLTGIHANTNIPKVLGAATRYELTGEKDYRDATAYFWEQVANHRSYATGGSNAGERWGEPDKLANTLVSNNQETCTSYNMLKVTRDLIGWTGDPKYADFYERLYFNGILPAQRPDNGMMIYYLPLEAGDRKAWGTPTDSFWCCYGTGVESFAKLGDSIYFHDKSDGLFVNLYVPSEVSWGARGVRVTQMTRFPEEQGSTLLLHCAGPTDLALNLHIPSWAEGATIRINGHDLGIAAKPSTYATIRRTWREGDTVQVTLPMRLHAVPMPDNPAMQAMMYGPLVLAGVMTPGAANRAPDLPATGLLRTAATEPAAFLAPVPHQPLTFQTVGTPAPTTFVPLYQIIDQPYAVYWSVVAPGSERDKAIVAIDKARAEEAARIVDSVQPNDAASEKAHDLIAEGSNSGVGLGRGWRDGQRFAWSLKTLPDRAMTLRVTYWGDDAGRTFDVVVGDRTIATETLNHNQPGKFFDVDYPIPAELTANNANAVTVRFQAHAGSVAGGVFRCATLKPGG